MGLERELKKGKLKSKRAMMLTVIIKIVLALICVFLAIYLMIKVFELAGLTNKLGEQQAKATILGLANTINLMKDGTGAYPVYIPLGWTIVAFDETTKVHDTFKIPSSLTFKNVICICKTGSCKGEFCQKIEKPLMQDEKLFLWRISGYKKFFVKDNGQYYEIQERTIDLTKQDVVNQDFLSGVKKDSSWELFNSQDTRITNYYTAYEQDSPLWKSPDTKTDAAGIYYCNIDKNKRMFYENVKCEGSGLGTDGQIYYYKTIKETKEESEPYTECAYCEFGITSKGTNPTIGRTIAVDSSLIPLLSYVYIEFDCNSQEITNRGEDCKIECEKWNKKYYIAEDVGGSIKGNHIDLYVGVGKDRYEAVNLCIPDYGKLLISPTKIELAKLKEQDLQNAQAVA